jgi:cytochrome c oxidase subunit 2
MNTVPGQVSRFWFTPTKPGRYEALCAQLCGVGHPTMRGYVVVEDAAAYQVWQKSLPTFAEALAAATAPPEAAAAGAPGSEAQAVVAKGRMLADSKGCMACHTVDGSPRVGPTWKGLYGKTETMSDGATAQVDEAYLRAFIRDPQARTVKGFAPVMPRIELSDEELSALVGYIQSLGNSTPPAGSEQKAQR